MMENKEREVEKFIRKHGMIGKGDVVIAGVSGGADSVCLLFVLCALQETLGFRVKACHVNHGLRGAEADEDEEYVRRLCRELEVPCRFFHENVELIAAKRKQSPEEAGRMVRREAFLAMCREDGGTKIATAHHRDDNAETVLLNMARGTGLHGAGGIRPARDFYVRPLLCLTRAEVEAYCRAAGQEWVTDETNLSDAYARNRLRHDALPALRQANAGAERNLARFCEKAARADAYFARAAGALLTGAAEAPGVWALEPLQKADPLVLEAAAHALVAPHRDPEERYIRLVCRMVRQGSGAVQLRPDVRLRAGQGRLRRETPPPEGDAPLEASSFRPEKRTEYPLGGGKILRARVEKGSFQEKTQVVHKKDLKNVADYARITMLHPALTLRSRLPGDTYRPAGRGVTKPLRKWMNEQAIPPAERDRLPLLADGSEVVWVCGAGFAEGLAPDGETGLALRLEIEAREGEERGR